MSTFNIPFQHYTGSLTMQQRKKNKYKRHTDWERRDETVPFKDDIVI